MQVKIILDRKFCIIAVAAALQGEQIIKSKKGFAGCIKEYLWLYGSLCIDDHENEYHEYIEAAEGITDIYYQE